MRKTGSWRSSIAEEFKKMLRLVGRGVFLMVSFGGEPRKKGIGVDWSVGVKLLIGEPQQPTMKTYSRRCGFETRFERTDTMQVRACTTRNTRQLMAISLVSGLMTLPAFAGTPAALDHVPGDVQAVVVVPNFGGLLDDVSAINTLLGEHGEDWVVMVTSMVRGWPGLNLDGSLAAVLEFEEGEDEPEGVALIPVSDFRALTQGLESKGAIFAMEMDGNTVYIRDAGGGFAVVGPEVDLVRDYDARAGNLKTHAAKLGKAGGRIAQGNDIFVYVNFEGFADEIAAGIEELEAEGEMVEMMGGAEAAAGFDAFMNVARTIANDGASFAMGINFDQATGVSFDAGLQFKDGSTSASYLQNNGNAGKYFNHAPAMDYFFASAFDLSGAGIQKLMGQYIEMAEQFDTTGMMGQMGLDTLMGDVKGGIQVMGASDNVMGGLFSKTMYYFEVKDADKYISATQQVYAGMNESMGELAQMGVEVNASMDTEPTAINGVEAYGYSFAMDMSQMGGMNMGGPNPAMILGMIFGADGGPSGYMAKVGDGIVTTLSRDASFFTQVAEGAKGVNTMAADASIAQTASMLPSNRMMETYIAADHLVNTAGPMLMMFGVIPEFEPLGALAPVGMACTADGGGVMFRTVVPIETIGAVMEMVPQDAYGDDGDDEMDF